MQRFSLLLDDGTVPEGPVLALNAVADPVLRDFGSVDCTQVDVVLCRSLREIAAVVETRGSDYALTLVRASRHRAVSRAMLADAWTATRSGGRIALSGAKTDGADALVRDLKAAGLDPQVQAKFHGKLAHFVRTDVEPPVFANWRKAMTPAPNADGYLTHPGVFSHAHVDPGSALLAGSLGPHIKGRVADLGAGWGYLSARLLEVADVTELHLIEADRSALALARQNVRHDAAHFHWADATDPNGLPTMLDTIIMNPPFHTGRAGEPGLGQAFIRTAAALLKPRGDLWLVANRHLPYEKALGETFRTVREVQSTSAYKIIRAEQPFRSQSGNQSSSLRKRA